LRAFVADLTKLGNQGAIKPLGLAVPKIEADDLVSVGATALVSARLRDMYTTWADVAKASAERAKEYLTRVLGEAEKRAKETQAFLDGVTQAQRDTRQAGANQLLDRRDDAGSRQRLRDIQTEQDRARAILERSLAARGVSYARQQQLLFEQDEFFNRKREAEEDRLALRKEQREANQKFGRFDELISGVAEYRKAVLDADKVIADPTTAADVRLQAIQQRQEALDKYKSTYSELKTLVGELARTEQVGGRDVVDQARLEKLKKQIAELSADIGATEKAGASGIVDATAAIATAFSQMATQSGSIADVARGRFNGLAESMKLTSAQAGEMVADVLLANETLVEGLNAIEERRIRGTGDARAVDAQGIRDFAEELKKLEFAPLGLSTESKVLVSEGIRDAVAAGLANGFAVKNNEGGTPVAVAPFASPEALAAFAGQIQKGGPYPVDLAGRLTSINGQDAVTVKIGKEARGGLIGGVAALGAGIARFAGGGSVTGPGNGTSDSILSWLSNGEYVMDALTTARFGPKFFKYLQEAARGGVAPKFLSGFHLPRFAGGGPVAVGRPASLAGFANDFKTATPVSRDVVDINISSGGQRATIQAEREQAKNLVSILRNFDKGRQ